LITHPQRLPWYESNVKKHNLTYRTLSHIQKEKESFVLIILEHEKLHGDLNVHKEMKKIKVMMTWIPFISQFKNLHHYVIIQPFNMTSLCQHYKDINNDHNFQMSHIYY
jgi:hypothetical protein